MRIAWLILVAILAIDICLYIGLIITVWQFLPTLLLSDFFSGGVLVLAGAVCGPVLIIARVSLGAAKLLRADSSEPAALALAMRRALAAGDAMMAPIMEARTEEDGEDAAVAPTPAMLGAESLAVAVPVPLIASLAAPIVLCGAGVLLLVAAGAGAQPALMALNVSLRQLLSARGAAIYLIAGWGVLIVTAFALLIVGWRLSRHRTLQRRGATIEISPLGLAYRQPVWKKRQRQITWSDMRALGKFTFTDLRVRQHTVYFLDGGTHTLLWEEPPTERYASYHVQQTIAAQQEGARGLAALISRRTKLPARDLSETIQALTGTSTSSPSFLREAYQGALMEGDVETATALWRLRRPGVRRLPRALAKLTTSISGVHTAASQSADALAAPAPSQPVSRWAMQVSAARAMLQAKRRLQLRVARALIPYYPTEDSQTTPVNFQPFLRIERARGVLIRQIIGAQVFMFIVILAGSGAFWYEEQHVNTITSTLSQQTQIQKPLYSAPLVRPQSDWNVQAATNDNPTTATFINGSYQLSCIDAYSSSISWIPQDEEGDIAIALTVVLHGRTAQSYLPTGGIVFDVTDNAYRFSTFGVDEHGNWILSRYDTVRDINSPWSSIESGSSPAIHTGEDATNRLLIVRHGALYLLYVNDTLVERYYDRDHAIPPGGDVGVYTGGGIIARFNDFTMYPVPPQLAAIPLSSDVPAWLK